MSTPNPASTDWIPLWDLNGGSGADLSYKGDIVGATNYKDGDIVVSNGIAYMCVTPTNNAPSAWPGGPTATSYVTAKPGYGTSFPASPVDGQEYILVDSITVPTYQWRFRYNSGNTSAYKWEFIGGSPLHNEWAGSNYTVPTASAWAPVPATGTKIVLPRAGIYVVDWAMNGQDQVGATMDLYTSIMDGDGSALAAYSDAWWRNFGAQYAKTSVSARRRATIGSTVNARTIDPRLNCTSANAFNCTMLEISAIPVAVS